MESTDGRESKSTALLDEIVPPRLEDAGLEDCALPPESIREAFLKAAFAVASRDDSDEDCKDDSSNDVDVRPMVDRPGTMVVVAGEESDRAEPGPYVEEKDGGGVMKTEKSAVEKDKEDVKGQ